MCLIMLEKIQVDNFIQMKELNRTQRLEILKADC